MMIRVGEASQLANLDEILHYYRVHRASLNGSSMYRVRLSIDYACELARRRERNLPEISVVQFEARRRARPVLERRLELLEHYALSQYRMAIADICGGRPIWGRLRLAWSAICSPGLTVRRIARMLRFSGQPEPDNDIRLKSSTSHQTRNRSLKPLKSRREPDTTVNAAH
jgi:hypothetical protein